MHNAQNTSTFEFAASKSWRSYEFRTFAKSTKSSILRLWPLFSFHKKEKWSTSRLSVRHSSWKILGAKCLLGRQLRFLGVHANAQDCSSTSNVWKQRTGPPRFEIVSMRLWNEIMLDERKLDKGWSTEHTRNKKIRLSDWMQQSRRR